ncbi:DEAD/DEAH box helicase [Bifidobacterium sp. SMB2]|uniref:DEAD/DEAH box helicase n=1 Tax=Bifidobacterium saimiriisciurei TaxID=2661627 RepID=A0ABX0CD91_9BIFI|nr:MULTISPECIES: ATP-dependent DNA helicase RecG [Bifidobacterium]NEG96216.1 DEAD/DEAH box helicase [Bifidobacterium sp. SMB2]NEH12229.1 DEAD/DEAH box helicase [Bifidobacterium saimiriisciurei]
MTIALDTAISSLMTNKRRIGALKSLGMTTVGEALTYYPFRVTDPVPVKPIRSVTIGVKAAFVATVRQMRVVPMNARRGFRVEATLDDADFVGGEGFGGGLPNVAPGTARLVFFSRNKGYTDWMGMRLRAGNVVVIAGEPTVFNNNLQFTHPDVIVVRDVGGRLPEIDSVDEALAKVSRPQPVYHASSRISTDHIHESILGFLRMMTAESAGSDKTEDGGRGVSAAAGDADAGPAAAAAGAAGAIGLEAESTPLDATSLAHAIPDILPESVRRQNRLMHRAEAFLAIHRPESVRQFHEGIRTMRFEEAFIAQTALLEARRHAATFDAFPCPSPENADDSFKERFIASLPFSLTAGQQTVIDDIAADMAKASPMQRLLQGEVGSGKTVVALAAMLQAIDAGHQAVLVAPTQVLAEQHYETIGRMTSKQGIDVLLLTGGMKLAVRRRVLAKAASGEPCIVVATHAAFSKTFQAPNLALAVIDEQHRFGVEQRETLRRKSEHAPHLLVMTATPIPRTAAMTWFGDLDISWLTELPGGRKPIRTIVVPEADGHTMARMFAHIRARVDAGERAYVVCPRIDEHPENDDDDTESTSGSASKSKRSSKAAKRGEEYGPIIDDPFDDEGDMESGAAPKPPLHSVEEIVSRLAALPQFRGIELATLTGRDDDETKRQVMDDFSSGKTPVLVATTVIEVGVDVPQASCIVIFDADRFGLSQLHQLRGRVGRGGTNSWAFLISRAEPDSLAAQRLEVIRTSTDGADIAQADIELRGAGDVLGDAQSGGQSSLKLLRVVKDADMIAEARGQAQALLDADPELRGEVELAGAVLDFTRGNEQFITST